MNENERTGEREYLRRVRKVLDTKLNGGSIMNGISKWAVSLLK